MQEMEHTKELKSCHFEYSSSKDLEPGNQARDLQEMSKIEKSLRRKFDRRILPLSIILYLCAFIDRSNMGNSRILGMEHDLKLFGYRFNIALTTFFITYIAFQM